MFRKCTIRALVGFTVVGMLPGWAAAQQATAGSSTEQLQRLQADKERIESQLRILRDGNSVGVLFGYYETGAGVFVETPAKFVPATRLEEIPPGQVPIVVPMSLKSISDSLTLEMMAGNVTREQAVQRLALLRIGAAAKRTLAVREGIERAERDYLAQLLALNAQIAALEAARIGRIDPQAFAVRTGKGMLKDETGKQPIGQFEIKKEGQRAQLIITYSPDNKIIATEESIDALAWTVVLKFEYHLPEEVGKLKTRGHAKLDLKANKVTLTTEQVLNPETNAYYDVPKQTSAHVLVWEEQLEDRQILSKSGKLTADAGENKAEVYFTIETRAGAHYTFELKAPATRLAFTVEELDGSNRVSRSMPERGKPARTVRQGSAAKYYRIIVNGVGANLPANFELEVWERWRVNGNLPPSNWDSDSRP